MLAVASWEFSSLEPYQTCGEVGVTSLVRTKCQLLFIFGGFQIVEKEDQLGGQLFGADPGQLGGLFVGFR